MRPIRLGCLVFFLLVCGGPAALVGAAAGGPLTLPGGAELRAGTEDVVMSNFAFQNGTTYFLDLSGTGARTLIEANYLEDSRTIELVLRHSTREDRIEQRLLTWQLP
ncbi:MAG TPA: hypothetical protein VFR15_05005 [Chloroflexia bacterium]|nr:hypothetical protein [Chloroflexia bacterium]